MHHTRYSGKTSPLIYDPEIEKTARKNRATHQTRPTPNMSHHSNQDNQSPPNQPDPIPPQQNPLGDMPPRPFQTAPTPRQQQPFPQFNPDPNAGGSRQFQQGHQEHDEWDEHYENDPAFEAPQQQQ